MNTTQEFINKDRLEHAELELKASAIKAQHVNLMMKKKPIELELAGLKSRVLSSKTHATRLSPEDYRAICNRQQALKKKLLEIEMQGGPLKQELRDVAALSTMSYAMRNKEMPAMLKIPEDKLHNVLLRNSVIQLRDKWIGFAEDQTRVNSMRVMAAQFSRELTEIISKDDGPVADVAA